MSFSVAKLVNYMVKTNFIRKKTCIFFVAKRKVFTFARVNRRMMDFETATSKVHVNLRIDENQSPRGFHLVSCPSCGQKLTDVTAVTGECFLRIRCRRCGRYIRAEIYGTSRQ